MDSEKALWMTSAVGPLTKPTLLEAESFGAVAV